MKDTRVNEKSSRCFVGVASIMHWLDMQRKPSKNILRLEDDCKFCHQVRRIVYVDKKICTRGQWQDMGLPCAHASIAISCGKEHVQSYPHNAYSLQSYSDTYKDPIFFAK